MDISRSDRRVGADDHGSVLEPPVRLRAGTVSRGIGIMNSRSRARADFAAIAAEYRAVATRDPRLFGFGYLAGDPATGAPGPFLWFAGVEELLGFLRTTEVALLQFDDDEADRLAAQLERATGATRDLARIDRDALSAAFEGWNEILWIGTFGDLCAKGGATTTGLRAAFRRDAQLGEHAGPISDDECASFVAYLSRLCPTIE
jgi:hypothetical protein